MSQIDLIARNVDVFTVRIFGEPRSAPKKEIRVVRTKAGKHIAIPFDRDYRKRKNPLTKKDEIYDRGFHKLWFTQVQQEVRRYMQRAGREPYPQSHPVALGMLFFRTRPKSNRSQIPTTTPDFDNFDYYVTNALKSCEEYPEGVMFYDDCQVMWRLSPSGVLWATEEEPPGVLITVADALTITDEINAELECVCKARV